MSISKGGMMKVLIIVLIFISSPALALDLTYTIPTDRVDKVVADWVYFSPNTECDVWDDSTRPPTCTQKTYTDRQWVKEDIKRWVKRQIERSRERQREDAEAPVESAEGDFN
jgi:hypothetical protein